MTQKQADRPTSGDGRMYHLETRPRDLAPWCLLVGSPERAELIATTLLEDARKVGDHRGLRSYTGFYHKLLVSVVTTGMGAPSLGIVMPEAVQSGARVFIRVGSCSTLQPDMHPGDVVVVAAACRLESASRNWAPSWYPAHAHHRVVTALEDATAELVLHEGHVKYNLGVEATTDCFYEGQARPNIDDKIPAALQAQHEELLRLGVACYSMEASALFIWCATHHGGLPAGAINAVYGNRLTNEFAVKGDELAARIALDALLDLAREKEFPHLVPPQK